MKMSYSNNVVLGSSLLVIIVSMMSNNFLAFAATTISEAGECQFPSAHLYTYSIKAFIPATYVGTCNTTEAVGIGKIIETSIQKEFHLQPTVYSSRNKLIYRPVFRKDNRRKLMPAAIHAFVNEARENEELFFNHKMIRRHLKNKNDQDEDQDDDDDDDDEYNLGFLYFGAGRCRGCDGDDGDSRRHRRRQLVTQPQQEWDLLAATMEPRLSYTCSIDLIRTYARANPKHCLFRKKSRVYVQLRRLRTTEM